jgi:hypothetical protein
MPSAKISVSHELPPEEALRRLRGLIASLRTQYGAQLTETNESWHSSGGEIAFRYSGFAIRGVAEVRIEAVELEVHFPFAALPFKSKIEAKIRENISNLLFSGHAN